MAAKKRAKQTSHVNGHAFAVVLEQLRGDFRVFGEALAATNDRLDALERTVNLRFDRLEAVALDHGRQLKEHGQQLKGHGQQLKEHGQQLKEHGQQLKEHGQQLNDHGLQLKGIRAVLEHKDDRDEAGASR